MRLKYAVTFEFDTRAPVTHRGIADAGSAAMCAKKAIQAAKKALRPVNWSSLVFCALERLPDSPQEGAEAIPEHISDADPASDPPDARAGR